MTRLVESVIPECLMGLPGDLADIDALLDDPRFFEPFRAFFDLTHGRPGTPTRQGTLTALSVLASSESVRLRRTTTSADAHKPAGE